MSIDLQARIMQIGLAATYFPFAAVRTPTQLFIVPMPPTRDPSDAANSLGILRAALNRDLS